ncbi:MAG: thiamine pyrophosphate-dependent enzyme [Rhizobiaceae bacterium]
MTINGGMLLAQCLEAQGVERVFCVPGESYLALLNGLHGSPIDVVTARHEGGAAMMAEADGKMTGRPGVVLVTRGPGATNAACGVHIAQQDSTPMVLFIGQIGRSMGGRDSFQEVDYRQMFGGMAKWAEEIRDAARIPEIVSHAWHVAMSGRPGPVVLALPEDMLRDAVEVMPGPKVAVDGPFCAPGQAEAAAAMLKQAHSPILIAGGSRWDNAAVEALKSVSEHWSLPVAVTFRRQGLFDANHPNYAGDAGLGINPALAARIRDADLVLLVGGRFSENPSQGFSLFEIPRPRQKLIHVHPGAEEIGRIYVADIGINAVPGSFLEQLANAGRAAKDNPQVLEASLAYHGWTDNLPDGVGKVTLSSVISHFRDVVGSDGIVCNGAGNYAIWLHRFLRYRPGMQLAPTSGSMGYGLPAAIAAALRYPEKEVFAFAGDGCFQMSGMEFAVAAERGLKIRAIVCDNGIYGTIRMHQARDYPGRVVATGMKNPDFAAWAASYGAQSFSVLDDSEFPDALEAARKTNGPSLIHLRTDWRDIAPGRQLEER